MEWCLIESDPGVFSELIKEIGVEGVQVEELYSLDPDSLQSLGKVHGLIFLFKWTGEKDSRVCESDPAGTFFFAKQVITNACATQAILNVLLNCEDINLGSELSQFKDFTTHFDSETKGFAITNSEKIRSVHNSFARAESLSIEEKPSKQKSEDLFHFIGYVPIHGQVYELDGLKNGPIRLGDCTKVNWLDVVTPVIQERMNKYQSSGSEIRFNLMAIVEDKIIATQRRIDELSQLMDTDQSLIAEEKARLEDIIYLEKEKRSRYSKENERRKHNFIPFIYNLLSIMAEKQALMPEIGRAHV